MRRTGPPSEILRLAEPLGQAVDWAWQRMHWRIGAMAVFYALSGITVIKSDEVAVVLRWGRLVGATPALEEHGPGLLFALPRPIDQVVRVQVKHVWEVPVTTLAPGPKPINDSGRPTLNLLTQGYALTGDQNVVQATMMARYRVSDPAEWAFYGPNSENILRAEVTSAMVRSLGEMGVDQVLSDGRERLVATATRRAQAGLDAAHSGLQLSSLELTRLAPPQALASSFDSVQSAFIGAQTQKSEAQATAEEAIPTARAQADSVVQKAHADADSDQAAAAGAADAFRALEKEYRANSGVVLQRLYRDAVEKAISVAGGVRWVPPPEGTSYHGFRITVGPNSSVTAVYGESGEAGEP